MSTYKVQPPDLDSCKSFDVYLTKLTVWEATTPAPEDKRGAIIASSLPNDSKRYKRDLQDKFYEQVDGLALVRAGGVKLVKDFLVKELGEEDLDKMVRVWDEFENCRRGDKSVVDFLDSFERCYNAVMAISTSARIPAEIRAFMVLKRAGVNDTQRMLVLSKLNMEDKAKMFDNMCKEIKLVLGGGPGTNQMAGEAMKVEPSLGEEGVFVASSGERFVRENFYRGGGGRGRGWGYRGRGAGGREREKPYSKGQLMENKKDEKGEVTRCRFCDSKFHYRGACAEYTKFLQENGREKNEIHLTIDEEEEIDFALATQEADQLSQFTQEARSCAALDTCCTSSVAGKPWLDLYIQELSLSDQRKVKGPNRGFRVFKFGNSGKLPSLGLYTIPVVIAGKNGTIDLDVIDSDIPLLLSKKAMKEMKMKINLEDDTVDVWGKRLDLITTSSGHYCLSLLGDAEEINVAWVLSVDLATLSKPEQMKMMRKLHKQFGHTPKEKFITFLKDANAWHAGLEEHLDKIIDNCKGCLILKRNPDKPVVGMPMAKNFNEKVAIDLKEIKENDGKKGYILHMVDMWSRLTQSVKIARKLPREVIDKFMIKWVSTFGIPKACLNDNGGEFTSQEIREFKSILNIIDLTTGAESPWQNGLCEKNHQIVDTMWTRMKEDYPDVDDDVLLGWANMAKNSMQMVYGFSSNQLVFGTNPNLPNIMNGGLPALEGRTSSETLAEHLNVLHSARKAFIESENSERIRKALTKKVCRNNTVYENGDSVWYKRRDKWMGPGKVVFQDGKVIFVRHGSIYVRVSANRIVKKGEEFGNDEPSDNSEPVQDTNPSNDAFIEAGDIETDGNDAEHVEADAAEDVVSNNGTLEVDAGEPGETINADETVVDNPTESSVSDQEEEPATEGGLESQESTNQELVDEFIDDAENNEEEDTSTGSGEKTIVTDDGKRKRKDDSDQLIEKRVAVEGRENAPIPKKKVVFPPNKQEKIKLKKGDWIEMEENGRLIRASILNREKLSGRYYNYFNIRGEDGLERNIDGERVKFKKLEEEECDMVMIPADRHKDDDCMEAKNVELKKLEEFDSYETVNDEGQYRISCRWILWYKGEEVRARLVARGFEELESVRSDSPTMDKCNLRLLLTICASEKWTLQSSDVKSAFLQGQHLDREVIIKPPKEAGVAAEKLWKLKVALYGLNDASLQLGCIQSTMDSALFYKRGQSGKLIGVIGLHVDDFLHCGSQDFERDVTQKLAEIFQMGKTVSKSFNYVGFDIDQKNDSIKVDQNKFAAGLELINIPPARAKQVDDKLTPEERSQLRKVAGQLGWLGRGSRPDLVFAQVEMSTHFVDGKVKDLNQAAKMMRKVKDSESYFTVRDLGNVSDWTVEVSTDASLCNLNDGVGSTGAKVVLLVNEKTGLCAPLAWHANKIARIVDSTLAAECVSLKEGLDEGIQIRQMIEEIYGLKDKTVAVKGIVDNKGTVDAIHSTSSVKDRKLRRDVGAIKQMMSEGEVAGVTWCPGKDQLADCMTKKGASAWDLMEVFQTGKRKAS